MKNIFVALMFVAISALSVGCGFTTIEPGHAGVYVSMGDLDQNTYHPGFHTYPLWGNMYEYSTQMQTYTFGTVQQRKDADGEVIEDENVHTSPSLRVMSKNQMSVDIEVAIQYEIVRQHLPKLREAFGDSFTTALIDVAIHSGVRNAAEHYEALELAGDKREQFQDLMEQTIIRQIADTLVSKGVPREAIKVANISLLKVDLPDNLEAAILEVQQQNMKTQERLSARATAEAEAERLRIEAQGRADSALISARGVAEANRIQVQSLTPMILRKMEIEAQYASRVNPNAHLIMVPYGQTTILNTGGNGGVATAVAGQ